MYEKCSQTFFEWSEMDGFIQSQTLTNLNSGFFYWVERAAAAGRTLPATTAFWLLKKTTGCFLPLSPPPGNFLTVGPVWIKMG